MFVESRVWSWLGTRFTFESTIVETLDHLCFSFSLSFSFLLWLLSPSHIRCAASWRYSVGGGGPSSWRSHDNQRSLEGWCDVAWAACPACPACPACDACAACAACPCV